MKLHVHFLILCDKIKPNTIIFCPFPLYSWLNMSWNASASISATKNNNQCSTWEIRMKVNVIKIIRNTIHVIELHRIRNGIKELKCLLRFFLLLSFISFVDIFWEWLFNGICKYASSHCVKVNAFKSLKKKKPFEQRWTRTCTILATYSVPFAYRCDLLLLLFYIDESSSMDHGIRKVINGIPKYLNTQKKLKINKRQLNR